MGTSFTFMQVPPPPTSIIQIIRDNHIQKDNIRVDTDETKKDVKMNKQIEKYLVED